MKKLFSLTAVTIGLIPLSCLGGTITLNLDFGAIYGTSTGVDFPSNGVGALVVSLNGASFPQGDALAGKSLTQYSDWGNGLYVLAPLAVTSTAVAGDPLTPAIRFVGVYSNIQYGTSAQYGANAANMGAGDQIALYWFPSITDTNATTGISNVTPSRSINTGDAYGYFRTDVVTLGETVAPGNTAFVLPADGATVRINAKNADALTSTQEGQIVGGLSTTVDFTANLTVGAVPEPSTYALMGLGLVVVGLISRRKKS